MPSRFNVPIAFAFQWQIAPWKSPSSVVDFQVIGSCERVKADCRPAKVICAVSNKECVPIFHIPAPIVKLAWLDNLRLFLAFFCMWYAIRVWDFYVKTTPKFQSCGQCERWPFNFVARSCGEIFQYSRTVCAESVQLGLSKWPLDPSNQLSFTLVSLKFIHQITSNQRSEPPRLRCELFTSGSCGDCSANRTSVM